MNINRLLCLGSYFMNNKYQKNIKVTLTGLIILWGVWSYLPANAAEAAVEVEAIEAEAEEEAPKFDIFEYQVEGNSKLSQVEIEKAVYPFLGEGKTFEDVSKAREALEKTYHEAGYLTVLVDIPEQEVANKVVTLSVTESKIGKLRVKNADYYGLGRIKTLAPSVQEGEVPNFKKIQKDIAKLNRTQDRRVTPVMKAGDKYGTVDVDLKVDDKPPVHGSIEVNDRYNQGTSRWRLGGTVSYDNLFDRDHSLSASFLVSPEDTSDVKVVSGNYLMRFDSTDALLAIYGVYSKSEVSTIGGIDVLGDGKILGVRYIKPLPSYDNYYHSISAGIDYKDFGQSIILGQSIEQPIRYAPFSASYTGTWQHQKSVTNLTAGTTFGLNGFLSSETDFAARRSGAKPNFFIVNTELNHTRDLESGLQIYGRLNTHLSGSRLVNNEQFLAGGVDTVRGYLETQAAGDQGLNTRLELRSPRLFKQINWLDSLKLSVFHDFSYLYTNDAQDGEDVEQSLHGAGFGVNLKAFKRFNLNWFAAWALKDNFVKEKGDFQSHLRVWLDF